MLRTCNGTDKTLVDPTGRTGSCGVVFDDAEQHPICPHERRRFARPLFDVFDAALRSYTLVAGRAGDFFVQCETCAFVKDNLNVNAVIHWAQIRTLAEGEKWARWHDDAAGHDNFPPAPAPQLADHHHHALGVVPCDRQHVDYPQTAQHAYAVLTLYGTHTYSAKVYVDLQVAQAEVERVYGVLVALPIVADFRHREPEPIPEIGADAGPVEQLAATGRATVAEHLVAPAPDPVDALREEYQDMTLANDQNPTEEGFVRWLAHRASNGVTSVPRVWANGTYHDDNSECGGPFKGGHQHMRAPGYRPPSAPFTPAEVAGAEVAMPDERLGADHAAAGWFDGQAAAS